MPSKGKFPGRQRQPRQDGPPTLTWVCSHAAREADYPDKTVSLHGFIDDSPELSARCQELDAKQQAWLVEQTKPDKRVTYDGTVGGLLSLYVTAKCSPYHQLKRKSRDKADWELRKLKRTIANRRVGKLDGGDFWSWYLAFRAPARDGGSKRITTAYNLMERVRRVFTVGVLLRLPHCAELREILHLLRFPNPGSRKYAIKFEQVTAFIAKAHELRYPEMALAQALSFDLTLRQGDVIGKWEYKEDDSSKLEWLGLRWDNIDKDLTLTYTTNKKQRPAAYPLKANELVYAELQRYAILPRIGPMIVDSETGQVFEDQEFRSRWRMIARAAGIPDEMQNQDSRAGGITEARNAGASKDDIRQHAGHAKVLTTDIYIRDDLEPNSRVAQARVAYRARTTPSNENF